MRSPKKYADDSVDRTRRFAPMTAATTRAVDAQAEALGVAGATLMTRAGAAVGERARALAAARAGPILVMAGPGKNGGDGYVAARLLTEAGRETRLFALGTPADGDAADAARAFAASGGRSAPLETLSLSDLSGAAAVVDALFGVGLTRPLEGAAADAAARLETLETRPPVLAVDVPSGVAADTGRALGPAIRADETVTFLAPKLGHVLGEGGVLTGALRVVDIFAELTPRLEAPPPATLIDDAALLAILKTSPIRHKYDYGHALVISGGYGASGAARLAAAGALRVGAGLVTVAAPAAALPECAAQLSTVMVRAADRPAEISALTADRRITSVALGMGHAAHPGGAARTRACVRALAATLDETQRLVLDADALSCWSDQPEALFKLLQHSRAVTALTPHGGEFARLFPDLAERLRRPSASFGKLHATQEAARRAGAAVLFKGADTIVAGPDGRSAVHGAFRDDAAPDLATAGSGDVLAGLIAGLFARGLDPLSALAAATRLHMRLARHLGPGLIAEDLPGAIPAVLAELPRP